MRKNISLLLLVGILSIVLLLICSCDITQSGSDETTVPENITAEFPLIKDGNANCKVIRSDNADDDVKSLVLGFYKELSEITGKNFDFDTDFAYRNQPKENDNYEIFIGDVDREATASVKARKIMSRDWCLTVIGKKCVVYSPTSYGLEGALEYLLELIENKVAADKDNCVITETEYHREKYNMANMKVNGVDFTEYSMIYPAGIGEQYLVELKKIQNAFGDKTGWLPELLPDTSEKREHEILVGNTSRVYSGDEGIPLSYGIRENNGNLEISYGGLYTIKEIAKNLFNLIQLDETGEIKAGYEKNVDMLSVRNVPLTGDANIRAISQNLLAEYPTWGGNEEKHPVEQRFEQLLANIAIYNPDFIGFQETSPLWQKCITTRMPSEFGIVTPDGEYFNYIAYRADKYELLEKGTKVYSVTNNARCRMVTWGVFKPINGGNLVMFASTHFDGYDDPAKCGTQVNEISALFDSVKAKYPGIGIILTGDFNNDFHLYSAPDTRSCLYKLCEIADLSDCRRAGEIKPTAPGTIHGVGGSTISSTISFDHIFMSNNFNCRRLFVQVDNYAGSISDHAMLIADIKR